ncbi:fimbrillin family protein [Bacteroides cellulosilyticus]|uniref:fimbrillin family protein n=1 Tax=Bacteroides cellulosilyticus TaxID=246787 RepID=UPI001C3755B9|nr:fimbrillin family protein [Bacteroides cellulosilyticus]MBV3638707.1 fimbrillin family protein [Bacteroides cellulosilyticus]MBV3664955.1 fimbrillin family protein [Bacteroides cellulosilyticus]MBV3686885.1 fimbrillin family protein [Bacteroides cellulosilyticus]MBV3695677.1 fimbrillin family protein [Bacteroides cellulosilyticus]MBV3709246.1 fimbrillin family protein [Bacteroides cellulosilyticus]
MKMNSLKSLVYFFACGVLLLASCQNSEDEPIAKQVSLHITTDIQTRAMNSTTFSEGQQIAVNVFDKWHTATYNGKEWVFDEDIPLTDTSVPVYAFYLDGAKQTIEKNRLFVTAGYINEYRETEDDYLYGKSSNDVNTGNATAHIHFFHIKARITLAITCNADRSLAYIGINNIGDNTCIKPNANFSWESGDYIGNTYGDGIDISNIDYQLSSKNVLNIDIYVVPMTIEKDGMAELQFTIGGFPYTVGIPAVTWEAGKHYTYPITININE